MKKINYSDAACILQYQENHFFEKFFCNHYLEMENPNSYIIYCYYKWWAYILLFPLTTLIHLFLCLWDGGLKEFEFEPRQLYAWHDCGGFNTLLEPEVTRFGRMEIVWKKYNPQ